MTGDAGGKGGHLISLVGEGIADAAEDAKDTVAA